MERMSFRQNFLMVKKLNLKYEMEVKEIQERRLDLLRRQQKLTIIQVFLMLRLRRLVMIRKRNFTSHLRI